MTAKIERSSPSQRPPDTPSRRASPLSTEHSALLAHFQLSGRPPQEQRWKGGRDVNSFLQNFKTLVEDFPGATADMCWIELQHRVTGTASKFLQPFTSEEPAEALKKTKEKYLRVWAETPRDTRELLREIVAKMAQVRTSNFTSLIEFVAELEEHYRQALLHGDASKFNEPEVILAIVAARLTPLED